MSGVDLMYHCTGIDVTSYFRSAAVATSVINSRKAKELVGLAHMWRIGLIIRRLTKPIGFTFHRRALIIVEYP